MSDEFKIGSIFDLKISTRPEDANIKEGHEICVKAFRAAIDKPNGVKTAALESFDAIQGKREFLSEIGKVLVEIVRNFGFYDLGVVRNDMVVHWAEKAVENPIAKKPWPKDAAVFVATHPDEMTFDKMLSVYVLHQISSGELILTEISFIQASETFLVYQSMVAAMPFGSTTAVQVIAHSEPPTPASVSSTLNPSLMAAAFLAHKSAGRS